MSGRRAFQKIAADELTSDNFHRRGAAALPPRACARARAHTQPRTLVPHVIYACCVRSWSHQNRDPPAWSGTRGGGCGLHNHPRFMHLALPRQRPDAFLFRVFLRSPASSPPHPPNRSNSSSTAEFGITGIIFDNCVDSGTNQGPKLLRK